MTQQINEQQITETLVIHEGKPVMAVTVANNSPTYDVTDPDSFQRYTIKWSKVYGHYYIHDNHLNTATAMSYKTMHDARRGVNNLETAKSDALSSIR